MIQKNRSTLQVAKNTLVAGALALTPLATLAGTIAPAQAQNSAASAMGSMNQVPTQVTGTVQNYWMDESGYVSAVSLKTANGDVVVNFPAGMANNLNGQYAVGSTANLWVQGTPRGGATQWNLVGTGAMMPTYGFWQPMYASGMQLLAASPMIVNGSSQVTAFGKLRRVIVNKDGQVVALALETQGIAQGAAKWNLLSAPAMGAPIWMASEGSAPYWTLVRVPPEMTPPPSHGNMRRKTPLMRGDEVAAVGYIEAPRYGALSPYNTRLYASAIVVNGRSAGALGFPTFYPRDKTLLNFNLKLPVIGGGPQGDLPVSTAGYQIYGGQNAWGTGTTGTWASGTYNDSND